MLSHLEDLEEIKLVIAEICRKYQVWRIELFGSFARGTATDESDIDLLVTFSPDTAVGLFEFVGLQQEISQRLNRPVDLLSRQSIEMSKNPTRRKAILENPMVIYERSPN